MKHTNINSDLRAKSYIDRHATEEQASKILAMSQKPIIIGGCGRSGTTLLLSILSCHPNIWCIPHETTALCPDAFHGIEYNKNPDLNMPFETWKIFEYLIKEPIPIFCTRWCEKTPRNVLYFKRILAYFGEGVRIIHIVRDGRDVITSRHPLKPDTFWVPPARWIQDVSAGKSFENHPQILTIRYEDLLREYEKTVKKICLFVEEDFHPNFLSYPESAKIQESVAWHEPVRKISTRSIGRWQKPEYAERIASLVADPKAVELLKYYGYL